MLMLNLYLKVAPCSGPQIMSHKVGLYDCTCFLEILITWNKLNIQLLCVDWTTQSYIYWKLNLTSQSIFFSFPSSVNKFETVAALIIHLLGHAATAGFVLGLGSFKCYLVYRQPLKEYFSSHSCESLNKSSCRLEPIK